MQTWEIGQNSSGAGRCEISRSKHICYESTSSAAGGKNGKEDMCDVAGGGAGDFKGYMGASQQGTKKSESSTTSKGTLP